MKRATQIWYPRLRKEGIAFKPVNFVHDEWQTEVTGDYDTSLYVANVQAEAITKAGEDLGLLCPMAGAILNAHGKPAIGSNWSETH